MSAPVQLTASLSPGCHQIDVIDGRLHVADTYNNRLLVFRTDQTPLQLVGEYYPPGQLKDGRASDNYAHMNSIWRSDSDTYVLFHNETTKTGRATEIARLDDRYQIAERFQTTAANGHNILIYDGQFMFCDSKAGTVVCGADVVFRCDRFTRGLSVTDHYVVVGRSDYGDRSEREQLAGGVTVLTHDFQTVLTINLPGMVQEIRSVGDRDYGLSASGRYAGFRSQADATSR
jgi:hypothetical protein